MQGGRTTASSPRRTARRFPAGAEREATARRSERRSRHPICGDRRRRSCRLAYANGPPVERAAEADELRVHWWLMEPTKRGSWLSVAFAVHRNVR